MSCFIFLFVRLKDLSKLFFYLFEIPSTIASVELFSIWIKYHLFLFLVWKLNRACFAIFPPRFASRAIELEDVRIAKRVDKNNKYEVNFFNQILTFPKHNTNFLRSSNIKTSEHIPPAAVKWRWKECCAEIGNYFFGFFFSSRFKNELKYSFNLFSWSLLHSLGKLKLRQFDFIAIICFIGFENEKNQEQSESCVLQLSVEIKLNGPHQHQPPSPERSSICHKTLFEYLQASCELLTDIFRAQKARSRALPAQDQRE